MGEINWYPGHMAKTLRLLREQIRKADLVIELCDARLPHSSRNPDLNRLIGGRKRLLLMNKADLADPDMSSRWLQEFRNEGLTASLIQARNLRTKDILTAIEEQTRDAVDRAAEKGVRKTVRIMVVGVPNVGKSTFINRINGASIAQTGDRPGVTRNNQWIKITPWLEMLDTPGMLWPRLDDQLAARRLCYIGTVKDEILNLDDLVLNLLNDIAEIRPESLQERFHVEDTSARGLELIEAVCRGRGFLQKGGVCDYDRCCSVVLDEFRSGKLGRITLESPHGRKENGESKPDGACTATAEL
ncbi:MAG: ribosome biogenesis GTPase YlqF [Clostridia bacterium]|nr:ribosome biogenesis GTPase YlqF [Clostridia bacterium]MBR7174667.1 ribosome biogenesis GTPase YlqF [Clostridia bacterium]